MIWHQADLIELYWLDAQFEGWRIFLQPKIALLDIDKQRIGDDAVHLDAELPLSIQMSFRPVRISRAEIQIVVRIAISQSRLGSFTIGDVLDERCVRGIGRVNNVVLDFRTGHWINFQADVSVQLPFRSIFKRLGMRLTRKLLQMSFFPLTMIAWCMLRML